MLCLNRKVNEVIYIKDSNGKELTLVVVNIKGKIVRLGFQEEDGERSFTVLRKEVKERIDNKEGANPYYKDQETYVETRKYAKKEMDQHNS